MCATYFELTNPVAQNICDNIIIVIDKPKVDR